jgi:hypothetical protein
VTGDIYGDEAVKALERRKPAEQSTPPAPTPEQPTQVSTPIQPAKKSWLLPLALAGALGTGAAIPLTYLALTRSATPPPATTDFEIDFPWYQIQPWTPPKTNR